VFAVSVHYLGMLALVFPGSIQYNAGLSIVAAVITYLLGMRQHFSVLWRAHSLPCFAAALMTLLFFHLHNAWRFLTAFVAGLIVIVHFLVRPNPSISTL
jgi:hypothetical protein